MKLVWLAYLVFGLPCVIQCNKLRTVCYPALQTVKKGQTVQLDFKLEKAKGDFTIRKYNITHLLNEVPGEEILFVRLSSTHTPTCKVEAPYEDILCYLSARGTVTLVILAFSAKHQGLYDGDEVGTHTETAADLGQSSSDSQRRNSCKLLGNGTLSTSTCNVANTDRGHDVTCHFNAVPAEERNMSFFVEILQTGLGEQSGTLTYCHHDSNDTFRCIHDKGQWFSVQRTTSGESFSVTVPVPSKGAVSFSCKSTSATVFIEEHPCFLPRDGPCPWENYRSGVHAIRGCSVTVVLFIVLLLAALLWGVPKCRSETTCDAVTVFKVVLCGLLLIFSFVTMLLSFALLE